MRIKTTIAILLAGIILGACRNSDDPFSDASYRRGYDDGVAAVCNDIYRFSRDMFDSLRQRRIC
ncbi:MAG: hypothetical protein WD823_00120 [Sulfuricaulis sp.]|uniref:hypothetical protein n=1 Tax=Sulfuricaulis sp. TaxID=2003553 RepID=UPI0034A29D46